MQKLIYKKLAPIIFSSEFHNTGYLNITSDGFMPLVIERLSEKLISLSHYFESNGDLVSDPDMVVEFDRMNETANAVSYQDAYRYQDVRDEFDRVSDKKFISHIHIPVS